MLKYYDIISRMSDSEKIRMLCDITCLSEKKYRALGIPDINVGLLEDYAEGEYPSAVALANSWNTELAFSVAEHLADNAAKQGVGFTKVPSPRARVNPYRTEISEEPLLASEISNQYVRAANAADIAVGLDGFGIYADEVEWLDAKPDNRFIREYVVSPYVNTAGGQGCAALLTHPDLSVKNYETVNSQLSCLVSDGKISSGATAIYAKVSSEKTVKHLIDGGLFFRGSALALESALSRYKKIESNIARGKSTTEELQTEMASGAAISSDVIDAAVDRLLDFVFSVKRKPNLRTVEAEDGLGRRAVTQSSVLLKNDYSILPLKPKSKIAFIGTPWVLEGESLLDSVIEQAEERGYISTGIAQGYDVDKERSVGFLEEALQLANCSDAVVVFLGRSKESARKAHKTKRIAIPANQQELLDNLAPYKKKVIAILPSDRSLDIVIPENCAAILLVPLDTVYSGQAIVDIVSGAVNPSGKLASTVYCNTDEMYVKYKTRRERDKMKVGTLIGYRYYGTTCEMPAFPFGHGLGYTKFAYSAMSVVGDTVQLVVQNQGDRDGTEIVQVYAGKDVSSVIRPAKQLCGFARVELKPGEKKTVNVNIKLPVVYSERAGKEIVEAGTYTIYAGSSVSDIRLFKTLVVSGEKLENDGESPSDYIQTKSNILTDNYKLEARIKAMKRSVFNIVVGALALFLAIVLKVFCSANGLNYAFFDWVAIGLGITGIVFFVREAIRRNGIRSEEKKKIDEMNKEAFKNAEEINVFSAERMFVGEFDTVAETSESDANNKIEGVDAEYLQYIDGDQSFALAADEIETFGIQKGIKFRSDVTKKILAAMSSSRLVVTSGMDDEEFKSLITVLAGYFETATFIDKVDDSYIGAENVLYSADASGAKHKTNVNLAIEAARNTPHHAFIAALSNVTAADLPAYFTPFANYAKNPVVNNRIVVANESNVETAYYIPQNTWFFLNLAEGETVDGLPVFISEIATVNKFELENCPVDRQEDLIRHCSFYQIDYLTEKAINKLHIDEDMWKKIDRIEEYVCNHGKFHIGNKLWLGLERFAYVYLACGGDARNALDEAIAAKLVVPSYCAVWGNLPDEELDFGVTVENILGEDRAEASKKVVRMCGMRRN